MMHRPIGPTVFPLVVMCLLFAAAASAEDRDDAKPLDTTVVLELSVGGQIVTVATATTHFAIESTFSEEQSDRENHFSTKIVIELGGTITQGKGGKPLLVEVHGTYSMDESQMETTERENDPAHHRLATNRRMALQASVYLRPGERTLIASHNDRQAWLTLKVPAQP